jgi:hypothetical protein
MLRFPFFLFGLAGFLSVHAQSARPVPADWQMVASTDSLVNPELRRLGRQYRLDSSALASFDKIITFDRQVYVGRIHNISFSEVRYTGPADNEIHSIGRSRISQILYAGGRRDVFIPLDDARVTQKELVDTSRIIIKNQKDWMKVVVTENPVDVSDLQALGGVKTRYEAEVGNMNNDEMMRQASINLKKKAAAMRAHCVLVETKFFQKTYGELPVVEVRGMAFGYK